MKGELALRFRRMYVLFTSLTSWAQLAQLARGQQKGTVGRKAAERKGAAAATAAVGAGECEGSDAYVQRVHMNGVQRLGGQQLAGSGGEEGAAGCLWEGEGGAAEVGIWRQAEGERQNMEEGQGEGERQGQGQGEEEGVEEGAEGDWDEGWMHSPQARLAACFRRLFVMHRALALWRKEAGEAGEERRQLVAEQLRRNKIQRLLTRAAGGAQGPAGEEGEVAVQGSAGQAGDAGEVGTAWAGAQGLAGEVGRPWARAQGLPGEAGGGGVRVHARRASGSGGGAGPPGRGVAKPSAMEGQGQQGQGYGEQGLRRGNAVVQGQGQGQGKGPGQARWRMGQPAAAAALGEAPPPAVRYPGTDNFGTSGPPRLATAARAEARKRATIVGAAMFGAAHGGGQGGGDRGPGRGSGFVSGYSSDGWDDGASVGAWSTAAAVGVKGGSRRQRRASDGGAWAEGTQKLEEGARQLREEGQAPPWQGAVSPARSAWAADSGLGATGEGAQAASAASAGDAACTGRSGSEQYTSPYTDAAASSHHASGDDACYRAGQAGGRGRWSASPHHSVLSVGVWDEAFKDGASKSAIPPAVPVVGDLAEAATGLGEGQGQAGAGGTEGSGGPSAGDVCAGAGQPQGARPEPGRWEQHLPDPNPQQYRLHQQRLCSVSPAASRCGSETPPVLARPEHVSAGRAGAVVVPAAAVPLGVRSAGGARSRSPSARRATTGAPSTPSSSAAAAVSRGGAGLASGPARGSAAAGAGTGVWARPGAAGGGAGTGAWAGAGTGTVGMARRATTGVVAAAQQEVDGAELARARKLEVLRKRQEAVGGWVVWADAGRWVGWWCALGCHQLVLGGGCAGGVRFMVGVCGCAEQAAIGGG